MFGYPFSLGGDLHDDLDLLDRFVVDLDRDDVDIQDSLPLAGGSFNSAGNGYPFQPPSNIAGNSQEREQAASPVMADVHLAHVHEVGFQLPLHDVPSATMAMLSFAMEPGEDEVHVIQNEDVPVQGRRKKPRKLRQPYTVTCALRKTNWFESSMEWDNEYFRSAYRLSKTTFWGIVGILEKNSIFQSQGRKKQRPVSYQLGVFLLRYGVMGSRAWHPKLLTSIGEGTVLLYCRRVIRAVREHGLECVAWPTDEEKVVIKAKFKEICGLDGIIGSVDGTLCGLETKPRVDGDSYVSRKKTLSVNVQAMVDHNGRFIAFESGWPGSRPDIAVWPNTWVFKNREDLFATGEFFLGDGGYPLSPFVLIPFNRKELHANGQGQRRREFNKKISRARIVVEWAFGQLKARFPALKRLGAVRDINDTYRAIEATLILHNMCFDFGDSPDGLAGEAGDVDPTDPGQDSQVNDETDDEGMDCNLHRAGVAFREQCIDLICPQ